VQREGAGLAREVHLRHVQGQKLGALRQPEPFALADEPDVACDQVVEGASLAFPTHAFEQEDLKAAKVLGERIVERWGADVEHRV
jgi:hypothetical protein